MIPAALLLPGDDATFVTNAYLAILDRWPDEGGLAHHLAVLAAQPHGRLAMLRDMPASEEARARGAALDFEAAATPAEAETAQLRLRVAFLLRERTRTEPPPAPDAALLEARALDAGTR